MTISLLTKSHYISTLLLLLFCLGCTNSTDKRFERFINTYINARYKQFPNWAFKEKNFYKYASVLVIPDKKKLRSDVTFYYNFLNGLKRYDIYDLNEENQIIYQKLETYLEEEFKRITENRAHEWNPEQYNIAPLFNDVLEGEYAPLEQRLKDIIKKMENVPAYYEAAKAAIREPNINKVLNSIEHHEKTYLFFYSKLTDAVYNSSLTASEREEYRHHSANALLAIKDYLAFCESLKFDYYHQKDLQDVE